MVPLDSPDRKPQAKWCMLTRQVIHRMHLRGSSIPAIFRSIRGRAGPITSTAVHGPGRCPEPEQGGDEMNDLRTYESPVATPDGLDRRSFVKAVTMAAAAVGLNATAAAKMVEAAVAGMKPSVIWLHFQECTGCTESLLRTSHPALAHAHPRPRLARLPRDADGRGRPPGRGGPPRGDEGERRQVRLRDRGRDPDEGRRHLLQDRRPDGARDRQRGGREGRRDHRDRLLRLVGRHPLRRPEPDRRDRRAR